jgi:polyisoprenyl-phosphate glycosyltransferase
MKDLSVVIPCFNEENNINEIVYQLEIIIAQNKNLNIEFILVNNGSSDGTLDRLNLLNKNNNFKVINLRKNLGYGGGILAGVNEANSSIIAWTHGDLQCDLNDTVKLYKKYKEKLISSKCLIKGTRVNRGFFDSLFSRSMAILTSIMFAKKFTEINAQPKIFNKDLFKHFINPPKDFSLDLFILYISKINNYEIIEFPVIYKKRLAGISKGGDSLKGKIKLSFRAIKYIIELRFNVFK